jgi:excisionase family DNA binding protein
MVKQAVTVLNYKGAKITEENIKDILGRRWAWKMGKLFQAVWQGEKGGLMNSECKNQNNGDSLLSYKQAAAMLNVCVRTLRRMVDVGQLVAVRIRGRVLFHLSDILKIQREGIS